MTAAAVTGLVAGDQQRYAETAAALALAVSAICLVCWLARLGFWPTCSPIRPHRLHGRHRGPDDRQPARLVSGIDVEGDSVLSELRYLAAHLDQVHRPTLLSGHRHVLLVAFHRLLPRWPGPLIAMVMAAAVAVLDLDQLGVATVGSVPRGLLPPASIPRLLRHRPGHLAAGRARCDCRRLLRQHRDRAAFAARRREIVDARQEFLALGAANAAAGVFSGFPVSSSGSWTAIGDSMGSRTQLYLVTVAILLLTVLFLGPALSALR